MALAVTHTKVVTIPDDPSYPVGSSEWNDNHTLAGTIEDALLPDKIIAGGPTGSATVVPVITYDAKGRLTAVTTATITQPSAANPTASVGLSAVNGSASTFMRSDAAPALDQTAAYAFSGLGATTISANGAASVSPLLQSGTILTGGTGTTNFPAYLIQPSGTTAVTTWSTSGTGLGMNLASGFAGNFVDFHVAGGTSLFRVTNSGSVVSANFVSAAGDLRALGNTSTITIGVSSDVILSRGGAAASLQFGAANAASPVAQILQAQGSRAGTDSNTAGANLSVQPGTGTGTPATSSAYILLAPKDIATATSAQTQTEVIRIQGGATPALKWTANNSTGAGSAALGANSPASTLTAPYTWVQVLAGDGSVCYMPIWK